MEILKSIPRNAWMVLGVILVLVIFASYQTGKSAGISERCA